MFVEHKEQGEVTEAPAKLDEVGKLLLKAADLLETGGHCKMILYQGDKHCVNGAILRASGWIQDYSWPNVAAEASANEAIQRLRVGLGFPRSEQHGPSWNDTANWNNRQDRTQAEVIAKLRAVALGL